MAIKPFKFIKLRKANVKKVAVKEYQQSSKERMTVLKDLAHTIELNSNFINCLL